MTALKAPQDHKPKAAPEAPEAPEPITVTIRGAEWTIDPDLMNDMDFLEGIEALNVGDLTRLPSFVRTLLGEAQYATAKDAVRDASGRVRPGDLMDLVKDILAGPTTVGEPLGESSAS